MSMRVTNDIHYDMASDFSGSDTQSLKYLDEFLGFGFDPDLSDNEEKVGEQENADS